MAGTDIPWGQRIYEKLDRVLCNENWNLRFPDAQVNVVPRVEFSDHHPLLITTVKNMHNLVPRPFRFESGWLTDNSYKDMINSAWQDNCNVNDNLKRVR